MVIADRVQNKEREIEVRGIEVKGIEEKGIEVGEAKIPSICTLEYFPIQGIKKGFMEVSYKTLSDGDWNSIKHLFEKEALITSRGGRISVREVFCLFLLKHFVGIPLSTYLDRDGVLGVVSTNLSIWKTHAVLDYALAILEARWTPGTKVTLSP